MIETIPIHSPLVVVITKYPISRLSQIPRIDRPLSFTTREDLDVSAFCFWDGGLNKVRDVNVHFDNVWEEDTVKRRNGVFFLWF